MGLKLATLVYVRNRDQTLMLHKAKGYQKGKWNGLGGKFEPGESPEDCMAREVFEESGLRVKAAQLKGFITFPAFDGLDDWYTFIYLVTDFSGEVIASSEGDLEWIPNNKILDLNIYDGDRIFIPWLEQDRFFSAVFRYDAGSFKDHEVTFY